jgi:hypothetical protein
MKLANFRAVDPLHTSQGKRGLSRGGHGVDEVWAAFAEHPAELPACTDPENEAETWSGGNVTSCFAKPDVLPVKPVGLISQKKSVHTAKASSKCIMSCRYTRFGVDQKPDFRTWR